MGSQSSKTSLEPAPPDSRAPTTLQTPQSKPPKKKKKTKPFNYDKAFNILAAYRPPSYSPPLEEMEGEIMAKRRMREYQAKVGSGNGRRKAVRKEGRIKKSDDDELPEYDVAISSESSANGATNT
ncbi:hypothetical protein D1P53_000079 [Cryptococcus gattii VGV]|nr:hypothetical protein D1P53_000079 [Cryptococcus gattii VGV]